MRSQPDFLALRAQRVALGFRLVPVGPEQLASEDVLSLKFQDLLGSFLVQCPELENDHKRQQRANDPEHDAQDDAQDT